MFDRIKKLISSLSSRGSQPQLDSEVKLEPLYQELQELVLQNEAKLFFNEKTIKDLERALKWEKEVVVSVKSERLRRFSLRRVRSLQERLKRLMRCSSIYADNINFNSSLAERLEEMKAVGMKSITSNLLEEVMLDHEEKFQTHKELIEAVAFC